MGRGTMNNGTVDAGAVDSRTNGLWDNEHGTVGHWRIKYWGIGAMGREGHGRRDNAQYVIAMDHLPSTHETQSISGLVVGYIVAIDVTRVRFPAAALSCMFIHSQTLHVLPKRTSCHKTTDG